MTQDEIIQMAREARWSGIYSQWISPTERQHLTVPVTIEQIETFANLVAAKEREACAILCDNRSSFYWNWQAGNLQKHEENRSYAKASEECADAIRARGNT